MDLEFPISPTKRAHLQHEVLCSGWWNINRFHAVHLFLFRCHLLSLDARLAYEPFRTSESGTHFFKRYIRDFETHWSSWTTQGTAGEPPFPLIMPWRSMPTFYLNAEVRLSQALTAMIPLFPAMTLENVDISMNQHAFTFQRGWHGMEYWNIMRVNKTKENSILDESLENRKLDRKFIQYFLPPRPLLTPPFTARKRGILVYLIQEAAGRCFITDIPDLNHNSTREDDERILRHAILEAIPLGDIPFLKILLVLLQGQNPPHLSPDQTYTGSLIAPAAGSQDRAMIQLYTEKASWSQEQMDEYVLVSMRSGNPEALTAILDIYAVYNRRVEDIEHFSQRMFGLLRRSELPDHASQEVIRNVIVIKIRSMKAGAIRSSDYARDKWFMESEAAYE